MIVAEGTLAKLIERSAAPAWAAVAAERIRESDPSVEARLRDERELARAFVTVTSASRALTELCLAEPAALHTPALPTQRHGRVGRRARGRP